MSSKYLKPQSSEVLLRSRLPKVLQESVSHCSGGRRLSHQVLVHKCHWHLHLHTHRAAHTGMQEFHDAVPEVLLYSALSGGRRTSFAGGEPTRKDFCHTQQLQWPQVTSPRKPAAKAAQPGSKF